MCMPVALGFAQASIAQSLNIFLKHLSPIERKTDPIKGEIQGLCPVGFPLFDEFCDDTTQDLFFIHTFGQEDMSRCEQCRDAFTAHLLLVTKDYPAPTM